MHFEFLVEDASGKISLEFLVKKILGENGKEHSYRFFAYKGVGHIPKNITSSSVVKKRMILNNLPRLLKGYGKSQKDFDAAVVVVVDLDTRNCEDFKQELLGLLDTCDPPPTTLFRIAIEEMEAWLLGDRSAVSTAYPKAKIQVLGGYRQDSICGTWEMLADAIYPGGSKELRKAGYPHAGQVKCEWATNIAPRMDIDVNRSKSFKVFRDGVRKLAGTTLSSGS